MLTEYVIDRFRLEKLKYLIWKSSKLFFLHFNHLMFLCLQFKMHVQAIDATMNLVN